MLDSKNGIIGLAIGDAMGVPLEFCFRDKLQENLTTEMIGYRSHNMPKGTWSDDTSMTLATIEAINKSGKIVPNDIADNFVKWIENAEFTPQNKVFGVGRTCLKAISNYKVKRSNAEECGECNDYSNGNGSLMRILPLVYYCYANNMNDYDILSTVTLVSSITHRNQISIMGCYIYVLFGIELLKGKAPKESYNIIKIKDYSMFSESCQNQYERILKQNIDTFEMDAIKSTGYVVDTLEATLWVLLTTENYNSAVIKAINLGNDTDTIGACVGGLAGIYYGIDNINLSWKRDLIKYEYIERLCDKFNDIIVKAMKNFNIKIEEKSERGIICRFYSEWKTKITVEDIKFFYSNTGKDYPKLEGILPIFLDNNNKLEFFEFPYKDKEYSSINFLVKERENIFAVRIDLKNDEIKIKDVSLNI